MTPSSTYNIDELVDTGADILETAEAVVSALSDGAQISDIFTLYSVAPKVTEIVKDRKTAYLELLDLSGEEAVEAARRIAARTQRPEGSVVAQINAGFALLARTYGMVKEATYLATDWVLWAKTIRPKTAA